MPHPSKPLHIACPKFWAFKTPMKLQKPRLSRFGGMFQAFFMPRTDGCQSLCRRGVTPSELRSHSLAPFGRAPHAPLTPTSVTYPVSQTCDKKPPPLWHPATGCAEGCGALPAPGCTQRETPLHTVSHRQRLQQTCDSCIPHEVYVWFQIENCKAPWIHLYLRNIEADLQL